MVRLSIFLFRIKNKKKGIFSQKLGLFQSPFRREGFEHASYSTKCPVKYSFSLKSTNKGRVECWCGDSAKQTFFINIKGAGRIEHTLLSPKEPVICSFFQNDANRVRDECVSGDHRRQSLKARLSTAKQGELPMSL